MILVLAGSSSMEWILHRQQKHQHHTHGDLRCRKNAHLNCPYVLREQINSLGRHIDAHTGTAIVKM